MKRLIIISSVFLAYVVLFTFFVLIYFYGIPGQRQYLGTTVTPTQGAELRKIPVKTCSGEGDLYLYEGDDPFQPIMTSFEAERTEVLIFTKDKDNLTFKVNSQDVIPSSVADRVFSLSVAYGSTISVDGERNEGARSIQGFLVQNPDKPVYNVDTFQFIIDDQRSNEMFLTAEVYTYAIFDKYTINSLGGNPDNRAVTVKVDGSGGNVVDKTYTSPYPDGTQGAVVNNFEISTQGNYTFSIDSEDSVYWALVDCPICGDGKAEKSEQCDDGDDNGVACVPLYNEECQYCSDVCELVTVKGPFCGDGQMNGTEQCDDGFSNGEVCFPEYGETCNYCSINCEIVSVGGSSCGDGVVDAGEQCDVGADNGKGCTPDEGGECTYCSESCTSITNKGAFCGDGEKNTEQEECDDGNNNNGDGCSSACEIEKEPEPKPKPEPEEDCGGSIGNFVWNDLNGDGVQDSNEPGLNNIRMKLKWAGPNGDLGDGDDEEFRTDTNSKGRYIFEDLCEGEYRVTVKDEDVTEYVQTYDPDGKLDNKTDVELEGNNDDHSKADFGYRGKKIAPAAGINAAALMMISTVLTALVLIVYEVMRKRKLKRR